MSGRSRCRPILVSLGAVRPGEPGTLRRTPAARRWYAVTLLAIVRPAENDCMPCEPILPALVRLSPCVRVVEFSVSVRTAVDRLHDHPPVIFDSQPGRSAPMIFTMKAETFGPAFASHFFAELKPTSSADSVFLLNVVPSGVAGRSRRSSIVAFSVTVAV
ncbi:hypothetical protein GCM10009565_52970 [Amycolatopsis albidoflavus]